MDDPPSVNGRPHNFRFRRFPTLALPRSGAKGLRTLRPVSQETTPSDGKIISQEWRKEKEFRQVPGAMTAFRPCLSAMAPMSSKTLEQGFAVDPPLENEADRSADMDRTPRFALLRLRRPTVSLSNSQTLSGPYAPIFLVEESSERNRLPAEPWSDGGNHFRPH